MGSKYVDTTAIIQVIGCVYNNPSLLDFTDKYVITENDFVDNFHKIVFGAIYKLYELGAHQVTLHNISDYFSNRPKYETIYESNKGEEWVNKAASVSIESSFDYYYGRMKKFSLLRAYESCGAGEIVNKLYDVDNLFDVKKKQIQEDWLDNISLTAIADKVDAMIDQVRSEYVDGDQFEASQAGDGAYELIQELKKRPEVGIPMYGPFVNTISRGARMRKFYLRSGASGTGKAIPNSTLIPTPSGWRKVGDIRPGDYLFGQNGQPTKVIQIHPQPTKKREWKLTLADGREAICCKDHLWEYRFESHGQHKFRVESTEKIYNRTLTLKDGFRNSGGQGFRFAIKNNKPIQYSEKNLPIDPYIFGLILGDGSFRYTNNQKEFMFSTKDEELVNSIGNSLNCKANKTSDFNYNWVFKPNDNPTHNLWVEELLKDYPELWQAKSEDKFIPEEYLRGSIEQRYALLQGLMDTDGSIDQSKGRTRYTTVSPKLKENIIELCYSLGMIATCSIDSRGIEKYTTGECYNIQIQCKKSVKPKLFRLQRKKQLAINYSNTEAREELKEYTSIVSIEELETESEMTCFTVDNEDHLFLMNNFITTHNTRAMIADACYFACDEIYDNSFGWISAGYQYPTLFIATEQDLSEVQTMMLAFLSNVNEEHILNGEYEGDEEDRVIKASEILKRSPLYVEELPDFSLQDVESKIRKNIRDHDIVAVVYDYLHTSLKILEEVSKRSGGVRLREDNVLFMLSTRLKDIANKEGIFILSGTQLSGDWKETDSPDQTLLRGSKAIADRIDLGSILLNVREDDIVKLEPILSNTGYEKPTIKISVYKNRRGRYKSIYLWCKADLGTCRIEPMFATTWAYELIDMQDIRIRVQPESAFEDDGN